MQKPEYTQPSIDLPIEEQIAYNIAYNEAMKAWLAAQQTNTTTTEE